MSVAPNPAQPSQVPGTELRRVSVNGVELNVATAGTGPAVLLLHGFPHTWRLWTDVMGGLAGQHRVIAPDLRGLGASSRAADGYDAETLAGDFLALLDACGERSAAVIGIDAGTPPAFLMAMRSPERVRRLVLMESLLGPLPGAEGFLAGGAPWWFGFHSVPGLAETVLPGNEAAYVDWFLDQGTLGEGSPRRSGTPSSARTPAPRPCGARSPTTAPCPRAAGRSGEPWRPAGCRCPRWPSAPGRWGVRWNSSCARSPTISPVTSSRTAVT